MVARKAGFRCREAEDPLTLGVLCQAYAAAGEADEGLALLERSRAKLESIGGNYSEAELQRVRGELLRIRSDDDEAEAAFGEALEIARSQRARPTNDLAETPAAGLLYREGPDSTRHVGPSITCRHQRR